MTNIISHRGIDAENHHPYSESSREAFEFFLKNGFGIEFDIQITKDNVPVISHDGTLDRIADKPCGPISSMDTATFLATPLTAGHTISLEELIDLINQYSTLQPGPCHALHLKHHNQTKEVLDLILSVITSSLKTPLLIFDAKPDVAQYIKSKALNFLLGASVAHPHDIERYNTAVGGTLLSLPDLLTHQASYDWAWLDEWDRVGVNGETKSLYTEETFSLLKDNAFKIAVVSPELHATSPQLLGGEAHQDAYTISTLKLRWQEIHSLAPDAICTDYPFTVLNQIKR